MSALLDATNSPVHSPAGVDAAKKVTTSPQKRSLKDDDLALARIIQEQERAFYMLQHGGHDEEEEPEYDDEPAPGPSGQGEAGADDEPVDDEEFARRLQEEEDRTAYQQMFGRPGVDYSHLGVEEGGLDGHPGDGGEGPEEDGAEGLSYEDLQALGDMAGTVSKGMAASAVARLPVQTYASLRACSNGLDKCCICQVEFEAEEELKVLPCSHFFHVECVDQWLGMNKVCVLCNKEVPAQPAT